MLATFIYNLSVYGGISLTLFLIFLLAKDYRQLNKRVLIGILLHFLILFIVYAFISEERALALMPFFLLLIYTLGPLIYTYVEAVYDSSLKIDHSFYQRFWPAVICSILLLLLFIFVTDSSFLQQAQLVLAMAGLATLWWYSLSAYRQLRRYRKLIREEYANTEAYDLRWLSNWMNGLLLLLAADVLLGAAATVFPALQTYIYLSVLAYALFIVYIGYQGLLQDGALLPARLATNTPSAASTLQENAATNYPTLGNPTEVKAQITALENLLQTEELFRKEDLNLRTLSEKLDLSDKQLSALLNQHLQTNFYEYINQYRVAAFQEAIRAGEAQDYTLLAVALNCGFSSKSSFNRIFKQYAGMTPSVFKRESDKKNAH